MKLFGLKITGNQCAGPMILQTKRNSHSHREKIEDTHAQKLQQQ